MRSFFALVAAILFSTMTFAQTSDAVQWSFSATKTGENAYELHLTATLGDEWHIYSQETSPGGPVPTEITFTPSPLFSFQGPVKEVGKLNRHFEPLFGVQVLQYSNKVDFVQKILLKHPVKIAVAGKIRFMTCNDHECLPPVTKEFSIALPQ